MVLRLVVCNSPFPSPHRRAVSVQDAESLQDRVAIGVWFADSSANDPVNDHVDRCISLHLRVCGSGVPGSED